MLQWFKTDIQPSTKSQGMAMWLACNVSCQEIAEMLLKERLGLLITERWCTAPIAVLLERYDLEISQQHKGVALLRHIITDSELSRNRD